MEVSKLHVKSQRSKHITPFLFREVAYKLMTQPKTVAKIFQFWQVYGIRSLIRRVTAVLSEYALGVFIPATKRCYSLPAGSCPSQEGMPEVIFLGCIEWEFRFQRPQQLCNALYRAGCRVHYCAPASIASWGKGWHVSPIRSKSEKVWHVRFLTPKRVTLQDIPDDAEAASCLSATIQHLVNTLAKDRKVVIVAEHPAWVCALKHIENAHIIYDCLDDFADFAFAPSNIKQDENSLVAISHAVVSTAQLLADRWKSFPIPQELIRNACDYSHFSKRPPALHPLPKNRPVIGYHGAIAEWFDSGLVEALALACPDCTLLLVGGALPKIAERLKKLPNVYLTGEVPYADLPQYIHTFDVGILPFCIQPLTLNTNPVKIYEYLAVGLPVVAVPLPEMQHFDSLVKVGEGQEFISHVQKSLFGVKDKEARQLFAQNNSWDARAKALLTLAASL